MRLMGRQDSGSQRSTLESFLDEYQIVRLVLNLAAIVMSSIVLLGGWWKGGSPWISLGGSAVIAAHAGWCIARGVRAPRTMLLLDTTLIGLIMLTLPDHPSVNAAIFALIALLIVLFSEGRWMLGLLAYATAWYVAASLNAGVADRIGNMDGSLFIVAGLVAVMYRIRRWLEQLDANRSQMLGTVSHELRNSLTGVLGLTDLVSSMEDLEPAEARELVEMANGQALDATEIVEDLLTASRVEREALTLHPESVDANQEVLTTTRRFEGDGPDIEVDLADDLPAAWADPLRVRQAIRNLVSNAVRYGGPSIQVFTREVPGRVEITVRDDGEGVPPEDEATIFLPYRRSTGGKRHSSSIGLGLWICRRLAHDMGGSLTYRRENGLTDFVLTLPLAAAEGAAEATDRGGKITVTGGRDSTSMDFSAPAIP